VNFGDRTNGDNAMNEFVIDPEQECIFTQAIPDEVVESAASSSRDERTDIFTQWICTALYYCPGP
jgi:hypothetical protein